MRRVCGRLRESTNRWSPPGRGPGTSNFLPKKKLLHAVDDMCASMLIVLIKISSCIPSSVVQESEHKDRAMNQAVFYRKLITMITIKLSSGRSRHKSFIL